MTSLCAPNIKNSDVDNIESHFTCFTTDELISIIKAFNNYIINKNLCKNNICIKRLSLITLPQLNKKNDHKKIKKLLWDKIYNTLKPICQYEDCWIDLDFINKIDDYNLREKLKYFTFKPKFYKNREKWLNTNDIEAVMKQYQKKYPDFYFIGAKPCDFYKYTKLNFKKLFSYKKIGIVFNLDKTGEPGSHWTCLFIDNDPDACSQTTAPTIYYFDSIGKTPNREIRTFIRIIGRALPQNKRTIHLYVNNKIHQKGNSECGVYSIYFLIKKLKTPCNKPVNNTLLSDKEMKTFRKYIFNIK